LNDYLLLFAVHCRDLPPSTVNHRSCPVGPSNSDHPTGRVRRLPGFRRALRLGSAGRREWTLFSEDPV